MRHKNQGTMTRQRLSSSAERSPVGRSHSDQPELEEIIKSIITTCEDPVRVLELFYFSQEPGALEIMRYLMALPEKGRRALRSFVDSGLDPRTISVDVDTWGRVTFSSPKIAEAMTVMRNSASGNG